MIIAVIFLISGIIQQLAMSQSGVLSDTLYIISFVVDILVFGISISIIQETISGLNTIPVINPIKNFIDGVRNIILLVIYFLIPAIITLILAYPTGLINNLNRVIAASQTITVNNSTTATSSIINIIPSNITGDFFISLIITVLIGIILFVIFALLANIAQAILAETGRIMSGLNIKDVIIKITGIGWGKYIGFIILVLVTTFIIGLISGIITLIPYIGRIIAAVVIDSYLLIFLARSTGLIYMEG